MLQYHAASLVLCSSAPQDKSTALHVAASQRHPWQLQCQVSSLLIQAKANPNAQNNGGATPLHCAATKGISLPSINQGKKFAQVINDCVILDLLRAKANPDVQNMRGKTPFDIAKQCGHDTEAALIQSKGNAKRVNLGDYSQSEVDNRYLMDNFRSSQISGSHHKVWRK